MCLYVYMLLRVCVQFTREEDQIQVMPGADRAPDLLQTKFRLPPVCSALQLHGALWTAAPVGMQA